MLATNGSPQRARWAVMWVYVNKRKKKKLFRKDFGDDYASAMELYLKAKMSNKPYATLACVNMGFPPPTALRPRTIRKRGRIRGTKQTKIVEIREEPLRELNHKGDLWCPYCRELRSFTLSKYAEISGVRMVDVRYLCPICKVSHRDHNVRVWNPTATLHMENVVSVRRVRAPQTKPTRRRSRT